MKFLHHRMILMPYYKALQDAGIEMASSEVTMIPQNYVELTDENRCEESAENTGSVWMKMMMYRQYIITGMNKKSCL